MRVPLLILPVILTLSAAASYAQIPSETDTTSTPVPNAGHDYIQGMSETVNPANGALSIRIGVPMPPSRGLTIPFGFDYDSNGSVYLGVPQCPGCQAPSSGMAWLSTNSMLARGGWSYGVPMLSVATDRFDVDYTEPNEQEGTFICQGRDNFVLQDANGNRRNLGLSYYNTNTYCQNGTEGSGGGEAVQSLNAQNGSLLAQTSGAWQGSVSNAPGQVDPVTVTEGDGTVYSFGSASAPENNMCGSIPCTATTYPPGGICDRNDNCLAISFTNNQADGDLPALPLSYTDSVGRPVLSIPTFGANPDTVSIYGLSQPYRVYWTTVKPNFTVTMTPVPIEGNTSCAAPTGQPSIPVISSIVLPNGQSYTFDYSNNPYGMVDKITYPTGAYVRYVWGVNPQSEYGSFPLYIQEIIPQPSGPGIPGPYVETGTCQYYYDSPAILQRFVSFDGVHEVLEQDFAYVDPQTGKSLTIWSPTYPNQWTSKATIVTTHDLVQQTTNTTKYTYTPVFTDYQPGVHSNPTPPQVPVESQILYEDANGDPLQTVNKSWLNERAISQQQTILGNGMTSESDWQYYPTTSYYTTKQSGWSYSPTMETMQYRYDYDYGSGGRGSLLRETYIPTYKNSFTNSQFIVDDPNNVQVLDGSGMLMQKRVYTYDGNGNLLSRSDWVNSSGSSVLKTSHTYDSYGNILSTTDPAGKVTTFSYTDSFVDASSCPYTSQSSNAYMTSITYPATSGAPSPDEVTFQYYCATGELASSTDENGNVISYQYQDPWNRLTGVTYPTNWGTESITYNDTPGSISMETKRLDGSGAAWSDEVDLFDGMFHQTSKNLANGQGSWDRTDTCYDGDSHVNTSVYPYQSSTDTGAPNWECTGLNPGDTFAYDALGRELTDTHSDGTVVTTAYTGRATDVKDEGNGTHNVERISQVDGLGRLQAVCEVTNTAQNTVTPVACGLDYGGTGFLTTYSYDASGSYGSLSNLTGVSQGSETRSFVYDLASRLTQLTNPETGTISYTYDSDSNCSTPTFRGELISKLDARGIRTCMQYDARHRVLAKTYSDGITPSVAYAYNQKSVDGRTLTNTVGRLSSESTGGSVPTASVFSYDSMGHVVDNSQCVQNCGPKAFYPVTYTYSVPGMQTATDGNGTTITYGYNSASRLISATTSLNDLGDNPGTVLSNVVYNAFGSPTSEVIGNAPLTDTRQYDVRGRVTSIADTVSKTPGSVNVTIGGAEQVASYSSGSVTFTGAELGNDGGELFLEIGGTDVYPVAYGPGSTTQTLASYLASQMGCNSGGDWTYPVQAFASGGTVVFYSCSAGTNTNYPLSTSANGTDFNITSSGAAMTPVTTETPTVSGYELTISGAPNGTTGTFGISLYSGPSQAPQVVDVNWTTSSTTTSLLSSVASALGSCSKSGNTIGATKVGSEVYITGCQPGALYSVSASVLECSCSGSQQDSWQFTVTTMADIVSFTQAASGSNSGEFNVTVTATGTGGTSTQQVFVSWGSSSTTASLAQSLAAALGTCSTSGTLMTGTAEGDLVYLTGCQDGTSYSVTAGMNGCGCGPGVGPLFSVGVANGQDVAIIPGPTYDSGTATLTVNGNQIASAPYNSISSPGSIAAALAASASGNSQVTVNQAYGNPGELTITENAAGTYPTDSYALAISYNSSIFSSPSFAATPSPGSIVPGGSATLYSWSVPQSGGYAPDGDILNSSDSVMGTWNYTYDDFNRIASGVPVSGEPASEGGQNLCFAYDQYGNRTAGGFQPTACSTPNPTATYNLNNQVTWTTVNSASAGFVYDQSGDVSYDGQYYYAWDGDGRQEGMQAQPLTGGEPTTDYVYDAEGRRVAKISNGTVSNIYVLGLGGEQVAEFNPNGWAHTNFFADGRLLATYEGPAGDEVQGYYFHMTDPLGTERVQTHADGDVDVTCISYPFGDGPGCLHATEHQFTGKERDTESGNDYFGARYYASTMGRFLSPDWSDKPGPVPYADFDNPQSLNLYQYMHNNPLGGTDPDGHCSIGGQTYGFWFCLGHALGLVETQQEQANVARNFFNNNDVLINGNRVDPSKMTDQQVLDAFKQYNDAYRANGGAANPNGAMAAMLPGAGLKYEPNPKHGSTARGNVSAEPTNPQQTLENSVQIKNSSTARVGVDPSTGEYVMFRETSPGVYHGYATTNFNDLPNEAKAALQDAGMVSQGGKIQ